jgi:(p)ppGpp synthase/HD superfamily hydrolase
MADSILSGLDGETTVSDPVQKARACAIKEHGEQMYGKHPYVYHLDAVHDLLIEYGVKEETVLVAAYLHDLLEDTEYPFWKMLTEHGFAASKIALFCTDEKGPSRRIRKQLTYERIREVLDKPREGSRDVNIRCVLVKLADRLSNIRNCMGPKAVAVKPCYRKMHASLQQCEGCLYEKPCGANPGLLDMYRKEQKAFKAALILPPSKSTPQLDQMWAEYEQLLG